MYSVYNSIHYINSIHCVQISCIDRVHTGVVSTCPAAIIFTRSVLRRCDNNKQWRNVTRGGRYATDNKGHLLTQLITNC